MRMGGEVYKNGGQSVFCLFQEITQTGFTGLIQKIF